MYKIVSWAAVIVWMLVIFNLSAQVAEQSNQLSTEVTEIVAGTVGKVKPDAEIDIRNLNHIIRKNAHFFCYLVLGLLAVNAFRRSGFIFLKSLIFSFLLCAIYAVSDEIHQMYVPGRGAQTADVLIDCSGAVAGLFLYWLTASLLGFKRRRKEIEFRMQPGD